MYPFNKIIKLLEWLSIKNFSHFIFEGDDALGNLVFFLNKVKDIYSWIKVDENVRKTKKMKTTKVEIGLDSFSVLSKIYHLIAVKMQSIVLKVMTKKNTKLIEEGRVGFIFGELIKKQYEKLNEVLNNDFSDINVLNVAL